MKLLKTGWVLALIVAGLAHPGAWLIARTSVEVWMIHPHSEGVALTNQALFEMDPPDPKDPKYVPTVIDNYGAREAGPIRVVFVDKKKLIHPKEMPSLTLLPVDKSKHENPVQVQTVWFFAKWTTLGSGAAFVLLVCLWLALRTRKKGVPA